MVVAGIGCGNRENGSLAHHGVFLLEAGLEVFHGALALLLEGFLGLLFLVDDGEHNIANFLHFGCLFHLVVDLLHEVDGAPGAVVVRVGGRGVQEFVFAVDSPLAVADHAVWIINLRDHLMRQLMSSFMYFQQILVFLRRVSPFRCTFDPQVKLRSSAMCTKLRMNFYIQLKLSQYSLSLLLSCITLSWNYLICFSSRAICKAASCSQVLGLVLTSGESTRWMTPLGLGRSFLFFYRELLLRERMVSRWFFLALLSSQYLSSRMILSLSSLLRCSCFTSSCSTSSRLELSPRFCGLRGWLWLSISMRSSSSEEVASWWWWLSGSSCSCLHCEHELEVSSSLLIQQIIMNAKQSAYLQSMNIPPLIPVKQPDVQRLLPSAIELALTRRLAHPHALSSADRVLVSKIYRNLNTLCKLSIKEVKELLRNEPAYQQALADLYFDKKINNYLLITSSDRPLDHPQKILLQEESLRHPSAVCGVEYRMEFTLSNIGKKNVMRPVILLVFLLKNGERLAVYYNLQQFSQLRAGVAGGMRQLFGIELRAL